MEKEFAGKVALVTGGTSGIGRATALAFAKRDANVAISGRRVEQGMETVSAIEKQGGKAIFIKADVSQASEVEAAIAKVVDTYGRLDFALNNAGNEGKPAAITELTEEDWDAVVDSNLKGTWLSLKYEIAQMLKQGSGRIVNTSSTYGQVGLANFSPYCASKHGVIGLTRSLALEYAKKGIRINAICPGPIDTNMPRRAISDPAVLEAYISTSVPVGRMGTAQEVAQTVIWLCSDAASFITGTVLTVDGGYLAQ
jgi:NAD(P)-dependent dehydrogenase (short-subunit alcohol dehydrogenase family)